VTENRKNILILVLVLALAVGAGVAVGAKGFVQGLDLRGGLQVVVKAEPTTNSSITSDQLNEAAAVMRRRVDPQGTLQPEIRTSPSDHTIEISLPGVSDPNELGDLVTAGGFLNFDFFKYLNPISQGTGGKFSSPTVSNSAYELLKKADAADKTGQANAYQWGLFDTKTKDFYKRTSLQHTKEQVLELTGSKTQPPGTEWLYVPQGQRAVSCDTTVANNPCLGAPVNAPATVWYMFDFPPADELVTGEQISSAKSDTDQNGNPAVSFTYKGNGADNFGRITKGLVDEANLNGITQGLPNAIVVDNQLVSVPVVNPQDNPNGIQPQPGNNGSQITGVSKSEADRLALEIQSGTLPVSFAVLSENVVSATLGKDALHSGLIAGVAGLILVMIFLLVVYGFLGLIADIALVIYGVLLAGIVALLPVTMTLPGIAGTILTIGVAADANIVIFERIKEEVRAGKSIRAAISTGYKRGFHTIIDANVVTLITAGVLYATATSSVKGFALMLLIGVITSIFTAVVATRAMLGVLGRFKFMANPRVLGAVGTGNRWNRFDFVGRKNWWFSLSAIILIAAAISLGVNGLNKGIDFTGGSQFDFKTKQALSTGQMSHLVSPITGPDTVVRGVVGAHDTQSNKYTHFQVQSHFLKAAEQSQLSHTLQGPKAGAYDINLRNVSSSFGQSVLDTAYLAVLFSLIIIFIYVWFRFEWVYAVPVMVALAHDILITIGIYSLSGRSVTADTIAAVLTVLGYSMYDTVIVFDRVRENIPILRKMTASKVVNESLAETVTRSLNTSFVTLIPVALLFIFGAGALKDFAFALIVGIASGAYSSIFVAAPVLAMLMERQPAFVRRRQEIAKGQPAVPVAVPATAGATASAGTVPAPASPPPAPSTTRRRRRAHGRNR
jgi:SecD/SecF fusion protein